MTQLFAFLILVDAMIGIGPLLIPLGIVALVVGLLLGLGDEWF